MVYNFNDVEIGGILLHYVFSVKFISDKVYIVLSVIKRGFSVTHTLWKN